MPAGTRPTAWTPQTAPKSPGRKGIPNKVTADIKAMVEEALTKAGGAEYLLACARHPGTRAAFLGLIGKLLPRDVNLSGTLKLEEIVDDLTAVVRARREAAAKALSGTSS